MNPLQLIIDARNACRSLIALLMEENATLTQYNSGGLEENLPQKKRLSQALEQALRDIKASSSGWKNNPAVQTQAIRLDEEVRYLQGLARSNTLMLQAAHQLRADLIIAIRDAVEANAPRAQLYNAVGGVATTQAGTRIIAREV
ncbi:MAG: hypothetical protein GC129_00660 [Proteobacteria bacterium]|nr:hypothetical protein [Pseudomonadota bacterium]